MEDSLNSTRNVPRTGNPQPSAAQPGASNSSDFQQTAPDKLLREDAHEEVTVENMGEPIVGGSATVVKSDNTAYFWVAGTLLVVILGVIVLYRLMRQEEAVVSAPAKPAPAPAKSSSKKTTAKKTSKKSSKSTSGKKRKSTAKRRK